MSPAKPTQRAYAYEALNRPVKTTYADGTAASYTYDDCTNGIGRLCILTDSSGSSTLWEYDSHGRTTARTQNTLVDRNTTMLTTRYHYNSTGQLTGLAYPSGMEVGYGYADGNITAITEPANTQAFGYDALNRLTAANDSSFNLAWEYDDNGNLIHDGMHSYQYNAQNRLAKVDEGTTAEYRYNALGQRVYKRGISSPCDVNRDGDVNHNDLKQATGKEKTTLQTDAPGKGRAKGKGQSIACIAKQMNNGRGKGKASQTGSREILFAYDEHRLLGEYDTQGNAIQETVWLGNLPVATIQDGKVYHIHTDHLGTPRVITDSDNTEVWEWESDPFGVAVADEDPDGDGVILS